MKNLLSIFTRYSVLNIQNWLFCCFITIACFYKLWLSSVVAFTVPMRYPIDGTWFVRKAKSISEGHWMGETFDHYTLIKGPAYSMLLSIVSSLGISPKLAIDSIYILACLVFLKSLSLVIKNRLSLLIGFSLLLFNPITFSEFWTQPIRINFYASLVLI